MIQQKSEQEIEKILPHNVENFNFIKNKKAEVHGKVFHYNRPINFEFAREESDEKTHILYAANQQTAFAQRAFDSVFFFFGSLNLYKLLSSTLYYKSATILSFSFNSITTTLSGAYLFSAYL